MSANSSSVTIAACYDHGAACPFFSFEQPHNSLHNFGEASYYDAKPAHAQCGGTGSGRLVWGILFDKKNPLVIAPPKECPLRNGPVTVALKEST